MIRLDPPVANAFVIFENVETRAIYVGKTDSQGKISLTIPKGTYIVHVVKEGYRYYKTRVVVSSNIVLSIVLTKIISPITESPTTIQKITSTSEAISSTDLSESPTTTVS